MKKNYASTLDAKMFEKLTTFNNKNPTAIPKSVRRSLAIVMTASGGKLITHETAYVEIAQTATITQMKSFCVTMLKHVYQGACFILSY